MPDHSNITAALSILHEAPNEDLQPHAEALSRIYCRLIGAPVVGRGPLALGSTSAGSTDRTNALSDRGANQNAGHGRVKPPKDASTTKKDAALNDLINSVKDNEQAIRGLFNQSVDEAVQKKQADEDVRITDIKSANDRSVETRYRKVLASRSLVIEYREWLRARGYTRKNSTSKAYMEDIGRKYEKYKYHYTRAEKILKYEGLAVTTISIIFVFCWGRAIRNNDINGFVHALKNDHKSLYTLLEERVDWFKRCQSIYDKQCEIRNRDISVDRIFIPYSHNEGGQAQSCGKRKSSPAKNGEVRNCRSRAVDDREGQTMEAVTKPTALSSTGQGNSGAASQPQHRQIHDERTDSTQDASQLADRSRQRGALDRDNVDLQTQNGLSAISEPERTEGDSMQYLPFSYDLAHGQARDYREVLDPNGSYMVSSGQYAFTTPHGDPLLHPDNIWWAESS